MKKYIAEYCKRGQYGYGVCTADTIGELINILFVKGYDFAEGEVTWIIAWSKSGSKKYYGNGVTICCGEPEMTEYTSY